MKEVWDFCEMQEKLRRILFIVWPEKLIMSKTYKILINSFIFHARRTYQSDHDKSNLLAVGKCNNVVEKFYAGTENY